MVLVEIKVSPELSNGKAVKDPESPSSKKLEDREQWANKAEFLLSCIGLSVGIGNVWRFPYLAYKNGGGAFLLAYIVMLILVGKPLFFAELALGQFAGMSTKHVWRCFPLGRGIGYAMIIMSVMVAIYYNVIMAYTLYFIGQSCRPVLPWKDCYEWWGADSNCYVRHGNMSSCRDAEKDLAEYYYEHPQNVTDQTMNLTLKDISVVVPTAEYMKAMNNCINGTQTASEQFWERYVLQLTSSIDDIGIIKWDLALTLFICWFLVFLGLMKGIKSSGKVVYFTATFPYVIIITLVIYGCTLPGAINGIKFFFIPKWSKLLDIEVWRAAAEQLLFSLSLGWGCLIMYASYNKFDNKLYKDAIIVSTLDFATSLMAGVVIFSVLGNLSSEMGLDISKVTKSGPGLAFVTYPEALARLPISQLWSVLFFFMLFLLALDSEFSYLENVSTAIFDDYPHLQNKKMPIIFSLCMLFFLLGLPCVTQGGQYVMDLMDKYGGGYAGLFVATIESMALMWGYGADRFADDIEFMLGTRPSLYWRLCWKYISPVVLLFVLIYGLSQHTITVYAGYRFPIWAEIVGWFLVVVSVIQIPIWGAVELYKHRKDPRVALRPHPNWGPSDPEIRQKYREHLLMKYGDPKEDGGIDNLGMETVSERL